MEAIGAIRHCCRSPVGELLAQENAEGTKNVLLYLSQTLVGPQEIYSTIENVCLALIFSIQKLHTISSIITGG